jgi:hypothetical protein
MSQNYATVHELLVPPGKAAPNLRISEGKWSLSSLSNVPFVTLTGMGFSKTFSWGELVEVPKGCDCQVVNASKHMGDIYLNAGWDYANRPARVTVPVPLVTIDLVTGVQTPYPSVIPPATIPTPPPAPFALSTMYPLDTRLARKAFLMMVYEIDIDEAQEFLIIGQPNTTSMNTFNIASLFEGVPWVFPKTGYVSSYRLEPLTRGVLIPLGFLADRAECCNIPHALLDFATVIWNIQFTEGGSKLPVEFVPAAFYVLEY